MELELLLNSLIIHITDVCCILKLCNCHTLDIHFETKMAPTKNNGMARAKLKKDKTEA